MFTNLDNVFIYTYKLLFKKKGKFTFLENKFSISCYKTRNFKFKEL